MAWPRLTLLGPLRIRRDDAELDAGPPQQAFLLAVLAARAGETVSSTELVELIWDDDVPASAHNIIQKYAGALRRLLEPDLAAREPGSYLVRHGDGYLFQPAPGMLDVAEFRALLDRARASFGDQALDCYVEALDLWHGPAAEGLPPAASFAALNREFLGACVTATGLALSRGRPAQLLGPLRLAARMAPDDERVRTSLAGVLAAVGKETGVPGAGLVGRAEEFAVLRQSVVAGLGGGSAVVVVEGEPGAGKTRLLEEAAAVAGRLGALVVWGRCLEGDGTPSMWPWVEAVRALIESLPQAVRRRWQDGELGRLVEPRGGPPAGPILPDSGSQFRLFEQAVDALAQVAAGQPVVLMVDDLQWGDVASLHMFAHLAARLPGAVVMIGALRDRAPAPGSELARLLAAVSRAPGHRRIRLGPLGPAEVAELVRRETGHAPGDGVARGIHARTAGNAYFVRELARLLADGGSITAVPSTVRDVVQDRILLLDDDARDLLQAAALIGRDVDLSLLARAAGLDVQTCLDHLAPLDALGLLEAAPGNPYLVRFPHDLVRESVAGTTPARSAARAHLRIADALQNRGSAEQLAHHLWEAGPLADPARTSGALLRAGRQAAGKSALEAAERHLHAAAQVARTAGLDTSELSALSELTAVAGMRSGYVGSALDLLERAEDLARRLGREREAADFLFSRWAAHSQGIQLDRAGRLARRLRQQGENSADPVVRAYGLHAWGIHQWDIGDIGEAYRYLSQSNRTMLDELTDRADEALRHDLQLLSPVMLALMTALSGRLGDARELLATLEAAAGDDSYPLTVWAAFAVTVAALAGDPAEARRAAERGIAADPDMTFVFLGGYQRLARCWARAVTGEDPAGAAAEAQRLIAVALLDPPRSGVATWYGLLAEMWLAAGQPGEAAAALDRADWFLETHGQRYPEALVLLIRARVMRAAGEPADRVRAVAAMARALAAERGAHLFAERATRYLASL
ncbi:AAA family ATPase [Actinoplanes sp. NPDC051861]|uniref:ATP-binding protein n=1 Tax=Actinoplanes sp. NPDC051861 TaxID=3155170 RepID=UPI0034442563